MRAMNSLFVAEAVSTEQSELIKLFTLELADTFVTGSGLLGSHELTVSVADDFVIGQTVTIEGLAGNFKITEVLGTTLSVDPPLPAAITDARIYFTLILCVADANYDLQYDGITYLRFPIQMSDLAIATDGSIDKPSLSVGNVTREIMYYVEQYGGLVNRRVTVKRVFKRFLDKLYTPNVDGTVTEVDNPEKDVTAFTQEDYVIDAYAADEKVVRFSLDPVIDLDIKLPRRRYLDSNSCSFRYRDPETCKYAGALPTCYKHLADCKRHGNSINFGGFAGLDSSNQRRVWL